MKKRGFKSWVLNRIETQRQLTFAAAAGMAGLGLFLLFVQGGLLYLVCGAAWGSIAAFLFVTTLFGAMGFVSWYQSQQDLADHRYKVDCDGTKQTVLVALPTSQIWTWAFGSLDSDQSIIQKLLGVVMLVPRLFCAAWYTWQRVEHVQTIDRPTTLALMKILFRKDSQVRVSEIAEELDGTDLKKAIRDLSLIDGFVFLSKGELGISIAPRLSDDLEEWRTQGQPDEDKDTIFGQ